MGWDPAPHLTRSELALRPGTLPNVPINTVRVPTLRDPKRPMSTLLEPEVPAYECSARKETGTTSRISPRKGLFDPMSSVQDHFDNKHVPGGTPWYVANAIGLPSGGCIGISDAPASLPLQWFHRHANQSDIARDGKERRMARIPQEVK